MTRAAIVSLLSLLVLFIAALLLCLAVPIDPTSHTGASSYGVPLATDDKSSSGVSAGACDRSVSGIPSTPIEAALDELRRRFPNQVVIAFEEFANEQRPTCEPHVDLGPPVTTLHQALDRVREVDARYRVELLKGRLVHVYPADDTADPPGLLDLAVRNFAVPPDDCLGSAMADGIARGRTVSYTPEVGEFLWRQQMDWDRRHGNPPRGTVGSILGDCYPSSRPGSPVHRNLTLRQALNIMAKRSLQVARGEARSNGPNYIEVKALSWKYRFRSDPQSDTGLGGTPVFQTF